MGRRDGGKTVGGSSVEKTAMVLSGGGAYAAYGVGVMRALFAGESPATGHTPLDPGIYAGASAGAFNAAYMVSQQGPTTGPRLPAWRVSGSIGSAAAGPAAKTACTACAAIRCATSSQDASRPTR